MEAFAKCITGTAKRVLASSKFILHQHEVELALLAIISKGTKLGLIKLNNKVTGKLISKKQFQQIVIVVLFLLCLHVGYVAFLGIANPYPVYFKGAVHSVLLDGRSQSVAPDGNLYLNPTGVYTLEYSYGDVNHVLKIDPDLNADDSSSLFISESQVEGSPKFEKIR